MRARDHASELTEPAGARDPPDATGRFAVVKPRSLPAVPIAPGCCQLERLRRQDGEGPAGCDVVGASDVDRVVALVHPRSLDEVRDVGQRRVADEVGEAARPDPPGPEVFVAIDSRAESDARIVEVDHDRAVEPDPVIELGQEGIERLWLADVDARRPRHERHRDRTRPDRA